MELGLSRRGYGILGNRRRRLHCLLLIVCAGFVLGQLAVHNLGRQLEDGRQQDDVGVGREQERRNAEQLTENHVLPAGNVEFRDDDNDDGDDDDTDDGDTDNKESAAGADNNVPVTKPRAIKPEVNSFISPYHKHWHVNCTAILSGNRTEVKQTSQMLKKLRDKEDRLPMASDNEVEQWMSNCSDYRLNRHFPDVALSAEEADYPLAYIIVTHKEIVQAERLLRAIYQPQNVYCIHPDTKSPDSFQTAIRKLASCFDNVFIVSEIESVQYAGFTRLKADINCMHDLNKHPVKWKYVMNLCAQDFPMKTNLEIVRQLKAYNGHNDINGIIPPPYIAGRTKFHHKMTGARPVKTKIRKSLPPHNLTIYFGNAYYAATWKFVDFVENDKVAIELLEWSNDTWSPDEHYWVTLQRSKFAPGGFPNATWEENIRFMKWADIKRHPACQGKYVRALCVFGVGYLEYLHQQPYLFANKFYYSFDPIAIQCMEEMLDDRTRHPEKSSRLVNFPIKDMSWQNYIRPTDPSQSDEREPESPELRDPESGKRELGGKELRDRERKLEAKELELAGRERELQGKERVLESKERELLGRKPEQ